MSIFNAADILLPKDIDYDKWSVVACDQFTSQRDYWDKVKELTNGRESTYHITFPEVYLNDGDSDERIKNINNTMNSYVERGLFKSFPDSLIYVERAQSNGKVRHGIIGAIDLEEYDFNKGSGSKIRATEGTIISRIPPRKKIRINAPLELPHIIMLIDDRECGIVEPLAGMTKDFSPVYDFELMMGSGHIKGWQINDGAKKNILERMKKLEDKKAFEEKYGVKNKPLLVIAAGDGNHSLATAKACWEEIKQGLSNEAREHHPARYALVEIENIHDTALEFEPIQRVVFGVDPEKLMGEFMKYYKNASYKDNGGQRIDFTYQGTEGSVYVKKAPCNLPVGTLQRFLDEYIEKTGAEIDYIHGNDVVRELTKQKNTIGFMVDKMEKNELFATVIKDGALPRKTFSMGEAADKRFYLECKRIR